MVDERYAGWSGSLGRSILEGDATLAQLAGRVESGEIDPSPASGHQELYENVVNRAVWTPEKVRELAR
jgi:xylose isomerase